MKKIFLTTTLFITSFFIFADEGMWMLQQLKQQKLAEMQKKGLKLTDTDIYNQTGISIKDAVVQFGNGCTGEVVSSQGLILTNHHCGYGQIQSHSTLENNYLETGFWAKSFSEELPNKNLTITTTEDIEDVTEYVKKALHRDRKKDKDGIFFLSPSYLNDLAIKKYGEKKLKNNPSIQVQIKPFFNGNQYIMFTRKVYSDVRLVGAPSSSIGKFGADTDNWMWPRHTGDFSVFRVYTDKEGNPAPYSPENIPWNPKKWLKVSVRGVEQRDFAMIMGFPGTTNKYYTSWEVAERRDIDNDVRINMRTIRQESMLEEMLADPQVKIQYASKYAGSANGHKNAIGTNWAINKRNFEDVKLNQQKRVLDWEKTVGGTRYAESLDAIEKIIKSRKELRFRNSMLREGLMAIEFTKIPIKIDNLLKAIKGNNKKAIDEEIKLLTKGYEKFANKDYSAKVDKKVAKALITEYVKLIKSRDLPSYLKNIEKDFAGNINNYVDNIFSRSIYGSKENFDNFLKNPTTNVLESDPMILFAKSVQKEAKDLSEALSKYDNDFAKARKVYLEGVIAMDGLYKHFPDANFSLRMSYGEVKGYYPRDDVYYGHQTTLTGVMEKEDPNNWEFVVEDKLKELYAKSDFGQYALPNGDLPVCFAATTHTTGGNSGSPVMNGNGSLIGINFDRNWEGVGGDIEYLPDYQRSIIVDIRYVLFIIDKVGNAKHLVDEMDIEK